MKDNESAPVSAKDTIRKIRERQKLLQNTPDSSAEKPVTMAENADRTLSRQRVSKSSTAVSTQDRQAVMHGIIKQLLLGGLTQGGALRKLRIEVLNLKQDAYAKLVSVSRKTLSDVENDKGNYTSEIINKLFKPFGLQVGLVPTSKQLLATLLG
jgi:DNA-binding XRE family transcriptional regulator